MIELLISPTSSHCGCLQESALSLRKGVRCCWMPDLCPFTKGWRRRDHFQALYVLRSHSGKAWDRPGRFIKACKLLSSRPQWQFLANSAVKASNGKCLHPYPSRYARDFSTASLCDICPCAPQPQRPIMALSKRLRRGIRVVR